jgi:RNA polymerase sigma-70 factor (ECF subfamily)
MNSADQFETIVGDHYEPLYRFAMSLTRSETDAWDLTQQTFYAWAMKGHQLRDSSKVKSWLFTTLHRAFLEGRRRQTRFAHDDWEEVAEQLPAFSPETADRVDSSQVLAALGRVDEVYRAAVALFYLEGCSYEEAAQILTVPQGTVKSRVARGIRQLREILGFVDDAMASTPMDAAACGCTRPVDAPGCSHERIKPAGPLVPSFAAVSWEPNHRTVPRTGVAAVGGSAR